MMKFIVNLQRPNPMAAMVLKQGVVPQLAPYHGGNDVSGAPHADPQPARHPRAIPAELRSILSIERAQESRRWLAAWPQIAPPPRRCTTCPGWRGSWRGAHRPEG
jgi:hypothetical protein